ncbi:hypothetical protein TNCV_865281 [Trichonephila clavipes]|nr:hypothetical protein TNCV_865281 [Trichonephila clavipes]
MTWSVAKSPRVAEQCDVNIQSIKNKATRGQFEMGLIILNLGQVTRMAPELVPLLQTTTSNHREDLQSSEQIGRASASLHGRFSVALGSNSCQSSLESETITTRQHISFLKGGGFGCIFQ